MTILNEIGEILGFIGVIGILISVGIAILKVLSMILVWYGEWGVTLAIFAGSIIAIIIGVVIIALGEWYG